MIKTNKKKTDTDPKIFQNISEFWAYQLNNEIYLREYPDVERGSKKYFDIILAARKKYIYYFEEMIDHLKQAPSDNFLEVGCGMGTDTLVFEKADFNVTGLDLTPAHLDLAEKLFNLFGCTGKFRHGNAEALPFSDETFDCIYSFGVLHHTPNTKKTIQEIQRVLTPKGHAVIMLYNKLSLNNLAHLITGRGFENVKEGADSPVTNRFSKAEVENMCSDFSHCDIKTEYLYGAGWGRVYDFTPKPIYHILSRLIGWHLVVYLKK